MNEQEEFWAGGFGNEYTTRNRVDWRSRIPFWSAMIELTGARSVYEFGCNAGWNLSAIRRAFPDVQVYGCDINETAVRQAMAAGINPAIGSQIATAELVFTAGVLIHIAPEHLADTMKKLVGASADYVLAVEYSAAQEEEVNYRGHAQRLWRRPYGKLYQDMGLEMVRHGPAGKAFDNCTYWLMRKP